MTRRLGPIPEGKGTANRCKVANCTRQQPFSAGWTRFARGKVISGSVLKVEVGMVRGCGLGLATTPGVRARKRCRMRRSCCRCPASAPRCSPRCLPKAATRWSGGTTTRCAVCAGWLQSPGVRAKSMIVTRRQAAHGRLRDAAYHWARVAAQRDRVSHDKYRSLRARGHQLPSSRPTSVSTGRHDRVLGLDRRRHRTNSKSA